MAPLIDRDKIRRAKEERAGKKRRILQEARSTLLRMPFAEVSLDMIGQHAGVERGVASMFFRTREELFLLLMREELEEWLAAVESSAREADAEAVLRLVATSLADRPDLTRFLSLLPVVLEQNVEAMEVFRFQKWRRDRAREVGAGLEASAAGLADGEGFRLLHMAQLIATGLESAAHPRGAGAYERGDPEFADLWNELGTELERLLPAVLSP